MLLRQIQLFQAVVKTNSFTEAAEEVHISQSAVSQQIKLLEEELGISLLERHNRTFSVTKAGEYFNKKSLALVAEYEQICRETVKIAQENDAQLNIGYLKSYGGVELQNAISEFASKYPKVQLHVMNGNHEDLYNALITGKADLVINDQRRAFSADYVNYELIENDCYIEIAKRNPLAEYDQIDMKELKDVPCILVASDEQQKTEENYYREIVGFQGEFFFADSLQEARIMVAAGRGIMPIEGITKGDYIDRAVKLIPLMKRGKPVRRKYCAFWNMDNSGFYVEEFADILKQQFAEI